MYKQVTLNNVLQNSVQRLSDNAFIPFDEANIDYQEYLIWLGQGNTPLSAGEA